MFLFNAISLCTHFENILSGNLESEFKLAWNRVACDTHAEKQDHGFMTRFLLYLDQCLCVGNASYIATYFSKFIWTQTYA